MIATEREWVEEMTTAAAQPLKSAKSHLLDLQCGDLTEFLEMETPPETIQITGECFVMLKGMRDISWKTARTLMADENFFQNLKELNCDAITSKQLSQCKNHLKVSSASDLRSLS